MATVPQPLSTVQFDTALRALRRRSGADRPRTRDRPNGGVTLHEDGTASAQSCRDQEVIYHVAGGVCDCPDFSRAPEGRCKHRFAVCLVKKAQRPALPYFATYTAPDGTEHEGIATQTGQGWLFVAEDGLEPLFASPGALMLCGQVDLAEAQLADDTRVQGSRVLTLLAR